MHGLILLPAMLLLAACAGVPVRAPAPAMPALSLSPASLGGPLALEQRLVFRHGERSDTVDALVEADAELVRIVLHRQGQVLLRLEWDGEQLQQNRAPQLPEALSAQRVLDDLQLVHWPVEAINAALPAGWRLQARDDERRLEQDGQLVATVRRTGENHVRLENHREGYLLDIRSVPVTP